ncbi:quinolinate synthase NadA [Candidatus Peregrinibacteria bacterium]|nr:quinolinate synthase NadA [Candidatus Peregrinibacteria bacterium]
MSTISFSTAQLKKEAERLFCHLKSLSWSYDDCLTYAPLTLEINTLKRQRHAVLLAHSYQTPDIVYGVADFTGDSYGLSVEAKKTDASVIVFCGVRFMAETAKILNPKKRVLLPAPDAGCSLADSITAADVRILKKKHPGVPVVCYVNTAAEVKAESDVCVTSANALKIIEALQGKKIIFIPDKLMAANLAMLTHKEIISWNGTCVVHERFDVAQLRAQRHEHPGLKILAHSECNSDIMKEADLMGGTTDILRTVKNSRDRDFMIVTECGLVDRLRSEFPEKRFLGTCNLCPFMKKNTLRNIRQVLLKPRKDQVVEIPETVRKKAERALERMFELNK